MAGRGHGKTAAGSQWVRSLAESGKYPRIALAGATVADTRNVMVEGESGILSVCPPWNRPHYQPSLRKLTWKNGTTAFTYSADEPERFRGPQHHAAWIDEPGAWRYGEPAFDQLMFGLRLGTKPMVLATTTPRPTKLIKDLVGNPKTAVTRGTTYDNRRHLAPAFFEEIITKYEGTRLGEQELMAELLELTEGAWFPDFSVAKHVSLDAEYLTGYQVHVAIDAGTSRHTGAVYFQAIPKKGSPDPDIHVFGDYYAMDLVSEDNAIAILKSVKSLTHQGNPEIVRLDPAAVARTGIGPAAYNEYERVFGARVISKWPMHGVVDGLDQIELMLGGKEKPTRLLFHPRCVHAIKAMQNYRRKEQNGEYLDSPVDPQHPFEEHCDALRGGIRDMFPGGRESEKKFSQKHVSQLY